MNSTKSQVLITSSRHDQPGETQNLSNYTKYFQGVLGDSYEIHSALLDDLIIDISPESFSIFDASNRTELSSYQLILIRGKLRQDSDVVLALSTYSIQKGIKFFNDYSANRSTSKLAQAVYLHNAKLPFPRTIYASPDKILAIIESGQLKYPFIYKDRYGSHGNNNFLINNQEKLSESARWGMVAQEFVSNNGDFRILIVGDQHLVIARTASGGSHLNNTSQGGQSQLVDNIDSGIIDQSFRIASTLNLSVAGIDLIFDIATNQPYFLEVNSQPQLMSGAFLDEKKALLKDYLTNLLK